jgi:hypothetical protein
VILAGWSNFRSVVSGFEVIDEKSKPVIQTSNEDEKA